MSPDGRGDFDSTPSPPPILREIFISFCFDYTLTSMCILLLQHVEDPGINIPDQTVIKKGKLYTHIHFNCTQTSPCVGVRCKRALHRG